MIVFFVRLNEMYEQTNKKKNKDYFMTNKKNVMILGMIINTKGTNEIETLINYFFERGTEN